MGECRYSAVTKTEAIEIAKILKALIGIQETSIIQNTFIRAFQLKGIPKADGRNYLHGNFNINGTVSGRLSSSKVNLQNLPSSGTKYAKRVKQCFQAPKGDPSILLIDNKKLSAIINSQKQPK